jgi:hypothetical protein
MMYSGSTLKLEVLRYLHMSAEVVAHLSRFGCALRSGGLGEMTLDKITATYLVGVG